ncbi:hypothetical protein BV25DRAFT_1917787 [Artomyces pyxidatus]|uniref:Uncharacterized protein n=1 Tax=Artomyces pyxidatus TaxID=48021 RepID=A0ACB8SVF9_9AGAM|nr:hypothetical protein BV25DRAFT_1917787 [Artomyces pyxidatus]
MGDTPIDIVILIGVLLTGILYGIHLVTFGKVVRVLLSKKRSRKSRRLHFLAATLLLLIVGTGYIALSFRHVLDAFVWYKGPGGPIGQLSHVANKVFNGMTILYIVQTSLGDAMLIYRCFVVYHRSWKVVILPSMLVVAGTVLGGFQVHTALGIQELALLSSSRLIPFTTSALGMTLAINLITTSLIVGKIWLIQRRSFLSFGSDCRVGRGRPLTRAIIIVIESGAIYTTAVILFFVLDLCSSNLQYPVAQCIVQIIGIAFNLIIIRVDQGKTTETIVTLLPETSNKRSGAPVQYNPRLSSRRPSVYSPDSLVSLPEHVHTFGRPIFSAGIDSSSTIMDISPGKHGRIASKDTV